MHSLLLSFEFAAPQQKEFGNKPLNWLANWILKYKKVSGELTKFPVLFLVTNEISVETSPHKTACSARLPFIARCAS